jgi:hypothetical protein
MTKFETMGVGCGGREADGWSRVSRGVERAVFHASPLRAIGTSFEGRA